MRQKILFFHYVFFAFILCSCSNKNTSEPQKELIKTDSTVLIYQLPAPRLIGTVTVEEALMKRRSRRSYINDFISAEAVSQILWAAYGITRPLNGKEGLHTAPSARRTYSLRLYLVAGKVKGIEPGVYRYHPAGHSISLTIPGDIRDSLCAAASNQKMIADAPACIFYAYEPSAIEKIYNNKDAISRIAAFDLGHSAENVYLQAEAIGMGTCAIGGYSKTDVRRVMQLPDNEEPIYLMPVGRYYKEE